MFASTHPDEARRLATLRSYGLSGTIEGAEFDDIVNLVSQICEAPVSLMSLVEVDRQWFAASCGTGLSETTLDKSVCAHTILDDGVLEIEDTLLDPRTADNPLCHDGTGMRFYAGVPLVAPNGLPIGALCVLDTKPRKLTQLQRETLRVLGGQVMAQLELQRNVALGEVLRSEMDHRVKNSLTMVGSLVRMYRRTAQTPEAEAAFDAVERRLSAIASLHRELHSTSQEERVSLKSFLGRVLAYLQVEAPAHVSLILEADEGSVDSTQASAIGAIVSEFVANALKYAFPNNEDGEVKVIIKMDADGFLEMLCTDNGVGLNQPKIESTSADALGAKLIAASAEQIKVDFETNLTSDGCYLKLSRRPETAEVTAAV
ncbi:histidine kinase dimerization/phosphoacceptor domain -containing protein [Litoreibacter halocynthiae]|uniref:histidine kinase dimerization/phosphoacceptor domain -containing protein n=1 Tax=Litoreibacter halocynthiae TaxID=1242689 RepID=UPI00249013D9|nr:histidine kinase dimerization/phosphoacceptor domain -containing protein [Litoreibacter halocynthiae]